MEVYGQEVEVSLLSRVLPRLTHRTVVDVGAERGAFVSAMLVAGATEIHAIEPEPRNLEALRKTFGGESRVRIHACAASSADGELDLHLANGPDGAPLSYGHTLLERDGGDEISWSDTVGVEARSLGSLVAGGEIPRRIGILKVDTEGHDLAVLHGMGELDSDVLVVEHWKDLPRSLGPCPWTIDELTATVRDAGFRHYAFVLHHRDAAFVRWDDATLPVGRMGNLVFLHDRVLTDLLPEVLESASLTARDAAERAERELATIDELRRERDLQAQAAEERLAAIDALRRENEVQAGAAAKRLLAIEELVAMVELAQPVYAAPHEVPSNLGALLREPVPPERSPTSPPTALADLPLETKGDESSKPPAPRRAVRLRRRARSTAGRVRGLWHPRIGWLRHYEPRPLRVPAGYLKTRPPVPAPAISLVTPSFQQGRFIERTLRSVLCQGYPALEYVVQDGGSTDETCAVLERFSGELAGWASERDEGQADAINCGFARTSGEIMAWLNSDDVLLPGSLAYVAGYFAAHAEVDVVYGDRIMIDEHDREIGAWVLPPHDDDALTVADYVPQETLFWRRPIWEAVGGALDPAFGYALDWDLLLRFRAEGAKMVHLPRFLGGFRIHDAQKTTSAHLFGRVEMARLRQREHGRPVPIVEVTERLRPYLRRHIVAHTRYRLVDRLPSQRVAVDLGVPDDGSRAASEAINGRVEPPAGGLPKRGAPASR